MSIELTLRFHSMITFMSAKLCPGYTCIYSDHWKSLKLSKVIHSRNICTFLCSLFIVFNHQLDINVSLSAYHATSKHYKTQMSRLVSQYLCKINSQAVY